MMGAAVGILLQSEPTIDPTWWALPNSTRYLYSALLLVVFLGLAALVYSLGGPLKRRLDDEVVEAIQSLTVSITGLLVAGALVVIWQLRDEVGTAFGFIETGPREGVLVLVTLAVFAAGFTVTRITKRLVRRGSEADAITAHQKEVAHHVIQILVFLPGALFTLALWGANPQNLLIGAGAAGVVLGLAARQTLGAIIAGFVLLFARPFEVNDWVIVDQQEGVVTDISIFNTEIRTFDNEVVVIPNDEVTKNNIVNRSRNGKLRIQVDVGVDYDVAVARAMELARNTMYAQEEVLDDPAPDVVLDEFGSSSVVLTLRFWISDPSIERKWAAQNAVVDAVKSAFDREGVKIPFPQRELAAREEAGGFHTVQNGREASQRRSRPDNGDRADDSDGKRSRATHMSAVTDPTVAIETESEGAADPNPPLDDDLVSAVDRVAPEQRADPGTQNETADDAESLTDPVEPVDPED